MSESELFGPGDLRRKIEYFYNPKARETSTTQEDPINDTHSDMQQEQEVANVKEKEDINPETRVSSLVQEKPLNEFSVTNQQQQINIINGQSQEVAEGKQVQDNKPVQKKTKNKKEKKPYSQKDDGTLIETAGTKFIEVERDESKKVPLRTSLEIVQERLKQQDNDIAPKDNLESNRIDIPINNLQRDLRRNPDYFYTPRTKETPTAQQEDDITNGQLPENNTLQPNPIEATQRIPKLGDNNIAPKATYDDLVKIINTSNENRFGNDKTAFPKINTLQPNPIEATQKIPKRGDNSIAPKATYDDLVKIINTSNENRFGNDKTAFLQNNTLQPSPIEATQRIPKLGDNTIATRNLINEQPQEVKREDLLNILKTVNENSTDEQLRSIIKASNGIRFGNEQQTVEKNTGSVNPISEIQPKTPNVGPKSFEVIQPSEGKGTVESITAKLNKYRDDLFNGRELTEEEVNILREDYLSRIPGYNERKKEYMDKLYPEADMQFLLLNRDFKKEIEEFNKSLKNSEGKYVFNKDTKDAARIFLLLYQKEEERLNLAKTVSQSEEEKVKDLSDQKKKRDYKKLALVAGLVTGVSAGLLGGATVASAIPVVAIGALGSAVVEKIGNSRMKKLQEKIKNETDQVKKDKLLKRMNNWSKVVKFAGIAKSFLGGAATGLALSTFISAKFMGGEGLIDKFSAAQNPQISPNTDRITSHIEERANTHTTDAISNKPNSWVQQSNTARANTSLPQSNSIGASTSNGNGVIVQNGTVNLPDSAWNSNLGGAPTVDLPGGEWNFSSYPGGIENMAAYQAEKDLVAAGLSRNQVLDSLGTRGVHSLLNSYQSQIASGTTNPELINTLKGLAQYDSKYQSLIDIIAK